MDSNKLFGTHGPFDSAVASALGLRVEGSAPNITMPRRDWALYYAALNPKSKVSERFVKYAGTSYPYIGRHSLVYMGQSAREVFDRLAYKCPHIKHFPIWADLFK